MIFSGFTSEFILGVKLLELVGLNAIHPQVIKGIPHSDLTIVFLLSTKNHKISFVKSCSVPESFRWSLSFSYYQRCPYSFLKVKLSHVIKSYFVITSKENSFGSTISEARPDSNTGLPNVMFLA